VVVARVIVVVIVVVVVVVVIVVVVVVARRKLTPLLSFSYNTGTQDIWRMVRKKKRIEGYADALGDVYDALGRIDEHRRASHSTTAELFRGE